jgi:hypothetical protein
MPRLDMLTDTAADTQPNEFADSIPLADTAGHWSRHGRRPAKRNRSWEKEHRPYRYVNVPTLLREKVLALAEHLEVTADEIARALIEYGLECLDGEKLELRVRPNPLGRKMTLFPRDQARGWKEAQGQRKAIPARQRSIFNHEKKIHPAVSYRFPKRLHDNLCGLAMELDVPVGEVVAVLLRHGLDAYQNGELSLHPEPLSMKMTLFGSRS